MRQISILLFFLLHSPALCHSIDARLKTVKTFAFAIGLGTLDQETITRLGEFDLVIVDAETTSAAKVSKLHRSGSLVLGYLSIGTIEPGRTWYKELKPYRLEYWDDWGEWYSDVSRSGFRSIILKSLVPKLMKKRFDGIFLDNVDMIETHAGQKTGMFELVKALSKSFRKDRKLLFAQNGDTFIASLAKYLDGWNREDVSLTYNFDESRYEENSEEEKVRSIKTLKRLHKAGLLTLATDYASSPNDISAQAGKERACAAGALYYVSTINLETLPDSPISCAPQ